MAIPQNFRLANEQKEKEEDPDTILSREVLLAAARRNSKPANKVSTIGIE